MRLKSGNWRLKIRDYTVIINTAITPNFYLVSILQMTDTLKQINSLSALNDKWGNY